MNGVDISAGLYGLIGTLVVAVLGLLGAIIKQWLEGTGAREQRYDQNLWKQIDSLNEKTEKLETKLAEQEAIADDVRERNFVLFQENLILQGKLDLAQAQQSLTASQLAEAREELTKLQKHHNQQYPQDYWRQEGTDE